MAFIDKQLTCRDCSNPFVFTSGEQEFYANKGLQNEPVRCPSCRSARKANRLTEPEEGYVKYGVFASFGGRTPRQMHPATCADCGMMTEVPFQPRGDRPVFCSTCYSKVKGAETADAAEPAPAESEAETEASEAEAEPSEAAAASSEPEAAPSEAAAVSSEPEAAPAEAAAASSEPKE